MSGYNYYLELHIGPISDLMAHGNRSHGLFMELIYGKMNGGVDGERKGRCVLLVSLAAKHTQHNTYTYTNLYNVSVIYSAVYCIVL